MVASKIEAPVFTESTSSLSTDQNNISAPAPVNEVVVNTSPAVVNNTVVETRPSATYVNAYYQGMEVTTEAPKLNGVYFKVQVSTAEFFNESDPMFDSIRTLGYFQTEQIIDKGWTRILVAEFFSLKEAKVAMEDARANGYPESFVVKYRNGKRLN